MGWLSATRGEDGSDLFWNLFTFSAVIFMLPYIGMALAFIKLRFSEPDLDRPSRVPGGTVGAIVAGGVVAVVLLISISLFIWVPEEGFSASTAIGFVVAVIVGEILIMMARSQSAKKVD